MSYILDALQRGALERERASGTVPGLQTRSITAEAAPRKGAAVMQQRWPLLALIIVLAVAAVSFILWPTSPESRLPASSPLATGSVAAPSSATVAAPTVVIPTAAAPEPIPVIPPATLPAAAASPAPAAAQPTASIAASVTAPTNTPKSAPVPSPPPPPQPSASAPQTPKASLPFLKDLPDALRTQIPPLAISGVVYSDNPAQRLILLNGQVLTQGSRAAEDLVLDEIHPRSSDFTFRGTRFKLSH